MRKICNDCRESFEMETPKLRDLGIAVAGDGAVKLFRGKGCIRCPGTGYQGRSGVYEVIPYTESIRRLTTADTDVEAITRKAKEEGMVNLRDNAVNKLLAGVTTYQEVLRVTWEQLAVQEE